MKFPNDDELRKLEDEFKARRAPDRVSNLARFVPTMLRFHLDGYSRQATYKFLKGAALISCSRASFYRWLESNVDLAAAAQAYAEAERVAQQEAEAQSANASASSVGDGRAEAATPASRPSATHLNASTSAAQSPSYEGKAHIAIFSTPLTAVSTLQSNLADEGIPAARDRAGKLATLEAILHRMDREDMGAVAKRTIERLDQRDSERARAAVERDGAA